MSAELTYLLCGMLCAGLGFVLGWALRALMHEAEPLTEEEHQAILRALDEERAEPSADDRLGVPQ